MRLKSRIGNEIQDYTRITMFNNYQMDFLMANLLPHQSTQMALRYGNNKVKAHQNNKIRRMKHPLQGASRQVVRD